MKGQTMPGPNGLIKGGVSNPAGAMGVRLDSQMYQCAVDKKFYNNANDPGKFVAMATGLQPNDPKNPNSGLGVVAVPTPVCEKCFDKLDFKDPSGVVKAEVGIKSEKIRV